jgi:CHAT domain-containing protein
VLPAGRPEAARLVDLGAAGTIDRLVAGYRTARTGAGGPQRAATLTAAGVALRAAVFDPVASALDGCTRLVLALDGELLRVSFDALPTGDGDYLLDRYCLSNIQTGRDLLRAGPASGGTASPAVVVGDPDFGDAGEAPAPAKRDILARLWTALRRLVTLGREAPDSQLDPRPAPVGQRGEPRFDPLPATRTEAEVIAGLLGVRAWLGGEATKARLNPCRSPRVLHLATHVYAREDRGRTDAAPESAKPVAWENPLRRTGVALAGADRGAGGRLTAWDVSGLDLNQTSAVLVTPPADVDAMAATALARSFLLAGARAVLAAPSSVPEAARRQLLEDFYQALLAGRPAAAALREAVRLLRARHDSPAVWGAFSCLATTVPTSAAHEPSDLF